MQSWATCTQKCSGILGDDALCLKLLFRSFGWRELPAQSFDFRLHKSSCRYPDTLYYHNVPHMVHKGIDGNQSKPKLPRLLSCTVHGSRFFSVLLFKHFGHQERLRVGHLKNRTRALNITWKYWTQLKHMIHCTLWAYLLTCNRH